MYNRIHAVHISHVSEATGCGHHATAELITAHVYESALDGISEQLLGSHGAQQTCQVVEVYRNSFDSCVAVGRRAREIPAHFRNKHNQFVWNATELQAGRIQGHRGWLYEGTVSIVLVLHFVEGHHIPRVQHVGRVRSQELEQQLGVFEVSNSDIFSSVEYS